MSRRLLSAAILAAIAVIGCTDQNSGPTAPLSSDPASQLTSEETIDGLLNSLFRPGDQIRSATSHFNYIRTKVRQGRYADAQSRVVTLDRFTLEQLDAGKLLDPAGSAPPSQELQIAALFCELDNYANDPGTMDTDCAAHLADAGDTEAAGGTIGFVGPEGGTVTTDDGWGGIQLPAGAVDQFVTLTIEPLAPGFPRGGPLNTGLDQYPLFFDFSVFPAGLAGDGEDFKEEAIVGMCQLDVGDGPFAPPSPEVEERLRIAHNIGLEGFEILPLASAPFLTCGDLDSSDPQFPPLVDLQLGAASTTPHTGVSAFAAMGWQRVAQVMSPVLEALLPTPAYATVLGKCCLGGLATKLSPFGAVDPESDSEVEQLGFTTPTSVSTGVPFNVTVTARDGAGVIVPDADGMVSLSLVGGADVCTLNGTTSQPFVNGSATFTGLTITGCGGGQVVTLGGAFGDVSGESSSFTVQNPIL